MKVVGDELTSPDRYRGYRAGLFALVALTLLCTHPARADSGMAFVDLAAGYLFMLGVFVVWLETWVLKVTLRISFGSVLGICGLVNVLSYLAGLPVFWAISNSGPLYTEINQYRNPALSMGLVAGVFLLSFGIEATLLKAAMKKAWRPIIKACLTANLVSYLVVLPLMGPFSYFPDYGVRSLVASSAEALGEEMDDVP